MNKQEKITKEDTFSVIAHEIRNSLSANKWVLEMVLNGDLGPITEDQKIFLEKSTKNNQRMIELVSDLIDSKKHKHVVKNLEFKPVDMVELVKDIMTDFRAHAHQEAVELEFTSPFEETLVAQINIHKMKSAIQEIIHNAMKYTQKGFVRVGVHDKGDNVTIEVQDTGIGIKESEQSHIFEKFFRASNAQKQEEIGSGLGLFAAQHIIEQHEGKVDFTSKEGVGSTFTITIPKTH